MSNTPITAGVKIIQKLSYESRVKRDAAFFII
jgi:hypothetical protein